MCSVCMLTVRKQRRRHGQSLVQTGLQKECTNLQFAANQRCSQVPCRTSQSPGLHLAQFPGSGSSYAKSTWSWLGCDCQFHIDHTIMHLFYTSVIQSIFAFCILVYYGNASSRDIHKVHRIIKQAQKVTQCQCQSIHEIYNIVCTRKVRLIVGDEAHPLHQFYSKLRSGIRFKSMRGRTKRYLTSFVPASITHFNSLCRR